MAAESGEDGVGRGSPRGDVATDKGGGVAVGTSSLGAREGEAGEGAAQPWGTPPGKRSRVVGPARVRPPGPEWPSAVGAVTGG